MESLTHKHKTKQQRPIHQFHGQETMRPISQSRGPETETFCPFLAPEIVKISRIIPGEMGQVLGPETHTFHQCLVPIVFSRILANTDENSMLWILYKIIRKKKKSRNGLILKSRN
jgi:hypothetical protein